MAIDDKPTAAWQEPDLQELCDEQRREQPRLEFKRELRLERDSEKRDVEHDVEGLANAGGGHIIYGIEEITTADGSKVASSLRPVTDGSLYDRLNNLLDGRGEPKIPFDLYAIPAADSGIYIVVEVHGHRRPHRANDGSYYIRRNLLVREMTEAEIAEAYRDRFQRQQVMAEEGGDGDGHVRPDERVRRGLTPAETVEYQQETGDAEAPGWLSAWVFPRSPSPGLFDPRNYDAHEFRGLAAPEMWRDHPLAYFTLTKTNAGFIGRLPPRDDTYPHYWVHFWPDGLLEFGDLQTSVVRPGEPTAPRLVATHAVAEYVHDFLAFSQSVFERLDYVGDVVAAARLTGVRGYRLAVEPTRYLRGNLVVSDDEISSDEWLGPVSALAEGARLVAHELSDRLFIAGGVEWGAYFFDDAGQYTGGRG